MKPSIGCNLVLLILLAAVSAWAGSIYKWVDESGVVHYTDQAATPKDNTADDR